MLKFIIVISCFTGNIIRKLSIFSGLKEKCFIFVTNLRKKGGNAKCFLTFFCLKLRTYKKVFINIVLEHK